MPDSEKKRDWMKANTVMLTVKLNKRTDADVIEWIEKKESKSGEIKRLIREEIARESC